MNQSSTTPSVVAPQRARHQIKPDAYEIVAGGHPVLELIRERHASRSQPGSRTDGATLALVVEGGGMRAAVSGGMVVAIEQLGLTNVFDKIYASSGGAFNAVYLMTGQALYGSSIYADELTTTRFIDLKRLPTSKPVVSLDYAIDGVMSGTRAVDWEAAVNSPIELHPIASSLTSRQAIDLGPPKSAEHLRRQLKATARVLVFGGEPDEIDGHRCVDASLYAGIPFDIAKEQGATHVLALLTRPAGVSRKPPSLLEKTVIAWKLRQIERWLPEDSVLRIEKYRQVVSDLEAATRDSSSLEVPAFAVQMRGPELSQLEQNPTKVRAAAIAGMEATFGLVGVEPQIVSALLPYV